jgi:signal transduction histidine kinase
MKNTPERYFNILKGVAGASIGQDIEADLADAFELGRLLVDQKVPPDEVTIIHHEALLQLACNQPNLRLAQVARNLTRPLMEMSMAYGLAFREQTDRRYQEIINDRLEQSRKLEAVGTLAAGIAHDFNNILGAIVGFAEMVGDDLPDGSIGKSNIQQILRASSRARDLIARMLAFASQSPVNPVSVDIVAEVRESIALLRGSLNPAVQIVLECELDTAFVLADPSQIQQIVMNLCINAADAMNDAGTINIRIEPARSNESALQESIESVCLSVADTGCGMAPEVMARVFDPFFTTKEPGKGSGLGLSVVYGIATQLGGAIEVRSRTSGDRAGTRFQVLLPLQSAQLTPE